MHNAASTALLQVITMIAGFIIPKVMMSVYGSEINGLGTSIKQFISAANLVQAGISAAAIYSLYKPLADKNIKIINGILTATRNFYLKMGWIFVGIVFILATLYPFWVSAESVSYWEIFALVLIYGFSSALDFFTLARYQVLLTADQKTYILSIASTVATVVNVVAFSGAAYAGLSIVWARFIALSSVIVRTVMLIYYCRKSYDYLNFHEVPINEALNKRWDALYLQILGAGHTVAPVMLATFFTDLKTLSVFAVYNLVALGMQNVLGIFSSGLAASFGEIIAKKELNTLQRAESEFEWAYYMLIAFCYGVAIVLIVPFIMIYTSGITDTNYDRPWIGILLMINGLLYNLKTPQGMLVISAGLYHETRWQTTIQGLLEAGGGAILGYFWGIYGILAGMIISNVYRDIDLPFFISKYVTKIPAYKSFLRMIPLTLVVVGIWGVQQLVGYVPTTVATWLLAAVAFSIVGLILAVLCSIIFEPAVTKRLVRRFLPKRNNERFF